MAILTICLESFSIENVSSSTKMKIFLHLPYMSKDKFLYKLVDNDCIAFYPIELTAAAVNGGVL